MTRFIEPATFEEVAGTNGQLLVVILPNGGFEIVVPAGAEMQEIPLPEDADMKTISAAVGSNLTYVRSATYYEACMGPSDARFMYVCCNGVCKKKKPAQSC